MRLAQPSVTAVYCSTRWCPATAHLKIATTSFDVNDALIEQSWAPVVEFGVASTYCPKCATEIRAAIQRKWNLP